MPLASVSNVLLPTRLKLISAVSGRDISVCSSIPECSEVFVTAGLAYVAAVPV